MQNETLYEELTSLKEITSQPRLSNTFHLLTDTINVDKAQAALYDKFILLKFKVSVLLLRNKEKTSTWRYLSHFSWSLTCSEKHRKLKSWENHMVFTLKEAIAAWP